MKYRIGAGFFFALLLLAACVNAPLDSSFRVVLPDAPGHWNEILGEPHWRLAWVGEGGTWLESDVLPGRDAPSLSLMHEWTTAVLAWPFWPARGLAPGMMRPAGALFPWDCSNGDLLLGWKGGAEAVLWKELAAADHSSAAGYRRLPWYFDWPRFRELLGSDNIPEAVRQDLWLADWKYIAQRTVQSGFDRRRIVSRDFRELAFPVPGGRWIGSSPFAPPLDAEPGSLLRVNIADTPDTWVSSGAILKCANSGWVLVDR